MQNIVKTFLTIQPTKMSETLTALPATQTPVQQALTKYNDLVETIQGIDIEDGQKMIDNAILKLREKYGSLTIDGVLDRTGYIIVDAARKQIKTLRVNVEKKRKELTEDALSYQRAVNSEAKRIIEQLVPLESYLQSKQYEIDAEKERLRQEQIRIEQERIASRVRQVLEHGAAFNPATETYGLNSVSITYTQIKEFDEHQFASFITNLKIEYDIEQEQIQQAKMAQLEAEAEEARIKAEEAKRQEAERLEFKRQQEELKAQQAEIKRMKEELQAQQEALKAQQAPKVEVIPEPAQTAPASINTISNTQPADYVPASATPELVDFSKPLPAKNTTAENIEADKTKLRSLYTYLNNAPTYTMSTGAGFTLMREVMEGINDICNTIKTKTKQF